MEFHDHFASNPVNKDIEVSEEVLAPIIHPNGDEWFLDDGLFYYLILE